MARPDPLPELLPSLPLGALMRPAAVLFALALAIILLVTACAFGADGAQGSPGALDRWAPQLASALVSAGIVVGWGRSELRNVVARLDNHADRLEDVEKQEVECGKTIVRIDTEQKNQGRRIDDIEVAWSRKFPA